MARSSNRVVDNTGIDYVGLQLEAGFTSSSAGGFTYLTQPPLTQSPRVFNQGPTSQSHKQTDLKEKKRKKKERKKKGPPKSLAQVISPLATLMPPSFATS